MGRQRRARRSTSRGGIRRGQSRELTEVANNAPPELLPAYGWRASIGFLQPGGANPHHPHEFYMMVPDGVVIHLISLHSVDDPPTEFLSQASLDLVMRPLP